MKKRTRAQTRKEDSDYDSFMDESDSLKGEVREN